MKKRILILFLPLIKIISLTLVLFLLTACEPQATLFDVPMCTWENLTSSEKIDAMDAYQQKKNCEAQHSPNIFREAIEPSPYFYYCPHGINRYY